MQSNIFALFVVNSQIEPLGFFFRFGSAPDGWVIMQYGYPFGIMIMTDLLRLSSHLCRGVSPSTDLCSEKEKTAQIKIKAWQKRKKHTDAS